MHSDLYVWARRQEIERELTREALLSKARDLTAEDDPTEKHSGPARVRQRVRGLSKGALSAMGGASLSLGRHGGPKGLGEGMDVGPA